MNNSPVLTLEDTVRVYSGKVHTCMCGCAGEYKDSERARKMAITALLKDPTARLQKWKPFGDSPDAGCIFVNGKTRTRVLYLTQEGVDKLSGLIQEVH